MLLLMMLLMIILSIMLLMLLLLLLMIVVLFISDVKAYVGVDARSRKGIFTWVDGTILPNVSTLWALNQPKINGEKIRKCVDIRASTGKLHNTCCKCKNHAYYCEVELFNATEFIPKESWLQN